MTLQNLFTETFVMDKWGRGSGSKSGIGSSLPYTESLRKKLIRFIKEHEIKTIFDCSCGDWTWMREVQQELPIYIGNDIVQELIDINNNNFSSNKVKFVCGDMIETLSNYEDGYFDLVICRHTLEHLPTQNTIDLLNVLTVKTKYAFITNSSLDSNRELYNFDGCSSRGINLNEYPYSDILGEPVEYFWDGIGLKDSFEKHEVENCMYIFSFENI
jgi:hypothetical protein